MKDNILSELKGHTQHIDRVHLKLDECYEWLPDFCTHCHTIGHDVTSCRWLYPQQDNVRKQKIVQGKKPVPTLK